MANFDPKKAREEGNQGVPPGDYLLAIRDFERKISKKDKPYLQCKIMIIAGAAMKKKFRDIISLDIENEGTAFRLALLLEACGHTGQIDLENDQALHRAILDRPFKARVNRKQEGQYTNNGIERYLVGDAVTRADAETMKEWVIAAEMENEYDAGHGGDAPHASQSGDDDIPF